MNEKLEKDIEESKSFLSKFDSFPLMMHIANWVITGFVNFQNLTPIVGWKRGEGERNYSILRYFFGY